MTSKTFTPLVLFGVVSFVAPPGFAQSGSPWSLDLTRDRADVTLNDVDAVWTADRLQVGWMRPEAGGWFLSGERQERSSQTDVSLGARAFRRLGDWTALAGVTAGPDADFLPRASVEGEISRRVVSTVVASGGYRFLDFRAVDIHQIQPALTWYHARGEVQARAYVTRNVDRQRTSSAVQVRSAFDPRPRLGLGGGFVYGARVFDVSLLADSSAKTVLGYAHARIGLTASDNLLVGGAIGHEEPSFDYLSFTVGYRRTF